MRRLVIAACAAVLSAAMYAGDRDGPPVLWRDPADLATRNLYFGAGGTADQPHGPFTFQQESFYGSNPKFEVTDPSGVVWTVKMGDEARPDTAASRFLWAVGYFAAEDYFVPELHVDGMRRLRRGGNLVSPDGVVRDVRLKRHNPGEKKLGPWEWRRNPFAGTREWYGLRVLMAIMNNWDLKNSNNSIYQVHGSSPEQRYMVTDLGASFGGTGFTGFSKGNLNDYQHSNWMGQHSGDSVDFNVPSVPSAPVIFNVPEFSHRMSLRWLGHGIPIEHVRWMANLLGRLSSAQIRDAFRSAGYSPKDVEGYTEALQQRVARLKGL